MRHYALEFEDSKRRNHWLREAARNGHVEAMYQYSMECDNPAEALHWLREAALEGHLLALEACALRCEEPKRKRRTAASRAATMAARSASDES